MLRHQVKSVVEELFRLATHSKASVQGRNYNVLYNDFQIKLPLYKRSLKREK
jgi:hypothetical protein